MYQPMARGYNFNIAPSYDTIEIDSHAVDIRLVLELFYDFDSRFHVFLNDGIINRTVVQRQNLTGSCNSGAAFRGMHILCQRKYWKTRFSS